MTISVLLLLRVEIDSTTVTWAPTCSKACIRSLGQPLDTNIWILRLFISKTWLVVGVLPRLSKIITFGWWIVIGSSSMLLSNNASDNSLSVKRQFNCGLSAKIVPIPTSMASCVARNTCPSRREDSFVIHWDCPVDVAIFPSSDIALFRVTKGLPVCI